MKNSAHILESRDVSFFKNKFEDLRAEEDAQGEPNQISIDFETLTGFVKLPELNVSTMTSNTPQQGESQMKNMSFPTLQ